MCKQNGMSNGMLSWILSEKYILIWIFDVRHKAHSHATFQNLGLDLVPTKIIIIIKII